MPRLRMPACLLASLLALPGVAHACSCIPPIDAGDIRVARHASVLRVTATAVPLGDNVSFGVALVKVIDRLRGDAAPKQLHYSLGLCCPLRIEAGREYIVFTDAPERSLSVHMGNLVALPSVSGYDRRYAGRYWREILAGKRALPEGHFDTQMRFLDGGPGPPPPP